MGIAYRYGWPLAPLLARIGVPVKIVVQVIKDEEAGVFVGTSNDLQGLVVEADSLEQLREEVQDLIPMLVCKPSDLGDNTYTDVRITDRLAHA